MGRKPVKNKKVPSDYPQISFRVSKEDKIEINYEIERIQISLNKKRKADQRYINKNDIFLLAFKKGLKSFN